jgi:hypothetical protein
MQFEWKRLMKTFISSFGFFTSTKLFFYLDVRGTDGFYTIHGISGTSKSLTYLDVRLK